MGISPRLHLGVPLKREIAAGLIRDMIADGTLLPGAPVPSAAELTRKTGYSPLTCRAAFRALLAEGALMPGVSANARLRVARLGRGTHKETLRETLSRTLAALRHAAGLTQLDLAAVLGVSLTTVGHGETGRIWQARDFWQHADQILDAGGDLLRLYDSYRAEGDAAPEEAEPAAPEEPVSTLPVLPVSVTITPDGVAVVWPDGTETLARPPEGKAATGNGQEL